MKTIYHYDAVTGMFLGVGEADKCPLTGKPLVPAFATTEPPPDFHGGQTAVFERGAWRVVDLPADPDQAQ